jgi:hypothetical protein
MTLTELVTEASTEHQLAEALYDSDLNPSPAELLAALKATHAHPYGNYAERWAIRHAKEILETVDYLRKWRGSDDS